MHLVENLFLDPHLEQEAAALLFDPIDPDPLGVVAVVPVEEENRIEDLGRNLLQ